MATDSASRQNAIAAGLKTYHGKACTKCQATERHVDGHYCCACYPNRGSGYGTITVPEKPITAPLGRALAAWVEIQRNNPNAHPFHLWPRFLKRLDKEAHAAAIKAMVAPLPPTLSSAKAAANRLAAYAETSGVNALEVRVRQALADGNDFLASRLRQEALALMRRGQAEIHQSTRRGSSDRV